MKRTLFLLTAVIAVGMYLLQGRPGDVLPPRDGKASVRIRRIAPEPAVIPQVREIDYFETDKDVTNWIGRHGEYRGVIRLRSSRFASQGNYSMAVYWRLKRWGEIILLHFPEDWQRYEVLAFDVYYPGKEPFVLELRIGDYFDYMNFEPELSRYSARSSIRPGLNRLRFSLPAMGKRIDIASRRKIIRMRALASNRLFYLDNMRLER